MAIICYGKKINMIIELKNEIYRKYIELSVLNKLIPKFFILFLFMRFI